MNHVNVDLVICNGSEQSQGAFLSKSGSHGNTCLYLNQISLERPVISADFSQ